MTLLLTFIGVLLISLIAYYIVPKNKRFIVLVLANIVFYIIMSKYLIVFIIFSTVSVYFAAKFIQTNNDKIVEIKEDKALVNKIEKQSKLIIFVTIASNLLIIGLLKYFQFFGSIFVDIFALFDVSLSWPIIKLALPIGISYYTLQAIGYLVDVRRKKIKADNNFIKVFLFLSFFPSVFEGPICRYEQTANQLYEGQDFDYNNLKFGAQRILWGLFKKSVIADRVALLVLTIADNPNEYSGAASLLFVIFYTIQLYADFSGFIDISLGAAEMYGIKLPENFKQPFFATSAQDFWKRWHITLGTWLKEYVFYSVALSPKIIKFSSKIKKRWKNHFTKMIPTIIALLAVWLSNGLWHGPEWKFIFYGIYYFIIISISMLCEPYVLKFYSKHNIDKNNKWLKVFRHIRTLFIIFLGETMFGANSLLDSFHILASLFVPYNGSLLELGLNYKEMIVAVISIIILVIVDLLKERNINIRENISKKALPIRWSIYILLIVAIIVFGAYGNGIYPSSPYIYGNF